jgi:hypothetical protein
MKLRVMTINFTRVKCESLDNSVNVSTTAEAIFAIFASVSCII